MTTGLTSRRCGHNELSEIDMVYSRSGASLSKEILHVEGTWVTLQLSPNLERRTGSHLHLTELLPWARHVHLCFWNSSWSTLAGGPARHLSPPPKMDYSLMAHECNYYGLFTGSSDCPFMSQTLPHSLTHISSLPICRDGADRQGKETI